MQPPHKHTFTGGINADDSADLLTDKVYLNAQNMRLGNSLFGDFGRLEAIESNRSIANTIAPTGTNIPLGRGEDYARDRCFAFFFNSAGNHFIAVMQRNETVLRVLQNTDVTGGLNFTNKQIHSIEIVNDLLYWVQDGEPMRINAEAAIKANNSGYTTTVTPYSLPLAYTVRTVIRKPPVLPAAVTKVVVGGLTTNHISDTGFRFCYYYEYRDGELSTLSPQTILAPANTATETNNGINVALPYGEKVEQDVSAVVLVAIFATEDAFYEVKRWERANIADLTEILAHNAGTTHLTFQFTNSYTGPAIDSVTKVKLHDFVWPCGTLVLARNRLHIAKIDEGYNTPSTTSLSFSVVYGTFPDNSGLLKSATSYSGGITFYDQFLRQCGVRESKNAQITTNELLFLSGVDPYRYRGEWTLSNTNATNEIPVEAAYYSVDMTKNKDVQSFFQAPTRQVVYADLNTSTNQYTFAATTFSSAHAGLGINANLLFGLGLGYSFNDGDILRLWMTTDDVTYAFYRLKVKGLQGNYIITDLVDIGTIPVFGFRGRFEVRTPASGAESANYHEVGQIFPITNPGTNSRAYSALTGVLPGDVYLITRNDGILVSYVMEAMNPNDKIWKEWNTSHGRVQVVDRLGKRYLATGQRWSNTYLPDTQVNGFSSFDVIDIKILPLEMVSIQRLILAGKVQEEGSVMLAVGEKQMESEYLGETQVVASSSTAFIASSSQTVGTTNSLQRSCGTRHPESIKKKDGLIFGMDIEQGVVWQYSRAGLLPISDYKMKQDWLNWSLAYSAQYSTNGPAIIGGVNEFTNEYQLSLPAVSGLGGYPWRMLDGNAKVVAFNFNYNVWVGSFIYQPGQMFYLNKKFYSITGAFFKCHDVNRADVLLDGVSVPSRVMFISTGGGFDRTKIWETISIIGKQAPENVFAESFLPYHQQTTLVANEFETVEGKHYASWLMNTIDDTLTPNEALLSGENMRSQALYIMLEWSSVAGAVTKQNRIFINSVYLGITLSSGHTI